MNILVKQGVIHVNSIAVMVEHDDVIVLQADTRQKYPSVLTSDHMAVLVAGPDTLRVENPDLPPTTVEVDVVNGDGWNLEANCGRYTVTMIFYKRKSNDDIRIWWDDSEGMWTRG